MSRRSGARIPAWARHSVIPPTLRTDLPLSICCSVANPQKHYRLCGPFSFIFSVYRSSFPGTKRPGRDGDHSRPSIDEVKNEWSFTSTPQHVFMTWTRTTLPSSLPSVKVQSGAEPKTLSSRTVQYYAIISGVVVVVCVTFVNNSLCEHRFCTYRVIQEESAILWEIIVCVILSKKFI
jgi:hypothetical protein